MKTDLELRNSIMRRVWGIYLMRQLANPALRLVVLAASVVAVVSSVSVKNVFENALRTSGVSGLANFSLTALLNTSLAVQVSLALMTLVVLWFAVDTVRNFAFARSMRISLADIA